MNKAANIFKKVLGGGKSVEEVLLASDNVAARAGKMLGNDAKAAREAQVAREVAKVESNYKGKMKFTKGQKARAEAEYLDNLNNLEKGIQKSNKADELRNHRRAAVNTMAGLGAVGLAGAAYNEHRKAKHREQLINSLSGRG